MNTSLKRTALVTMTLAAVLMAGCARRPALSFDPSGPTMTATEADALAQGADIGSFERLPSEDAERERATALAELRTKGAKGEEAARLLTEGFPSAVRSVPVIVRYCTFESTAAVVVVEAFGDEGSTLRHRRLWVFRRVDGSVMRASSFR